jgi:hypothetical protein
VRPDAAARCLSWANVAGSMSMVIRMNRNVRSVHHDVKRWHQDADRRASPARRRAAAGPATARLLTRARP